MSGRKPVPVAAIDNKKSRYTKEQLEMRQAGEPTGADAALRCPPYLTDAAKREWRRVVKLHNQLSYKIWNDLDVQSLVEYCESVAIYQKAQEEWKDRERVMVEDDKCNEVMAPYVKVMLEISKTIRALKEQLCMSALGRARLGVAAANRGNGGGDGADDLLD